MANEEEQDEPFAIDSDDPLAREDGEPGPPDGWVLPSWYDPTERDWFALIDGVWRRDPCPARPLGVSDGVARFVTSFGEIRDFTTNQLMGRGGLTDLFVGQMWWPMRHFRKWNHEKKQLEGGIQVQRCVNHLVRWCAQVGGFFDGRKPVRSFGIWPGPIVHAGDRVFGTDGQILDPGCEIDGALFVRAAPRQAPAYVNRGRQGYDWLDVGPELGRIVAGHLREWVWSSEEACDLYQGGLHCDLLCSALIWLPHKFVLAPYGSGKSSLLRYSRAAAGDSAHAVQKTYSKAYLEQAFAGTAAAFYLDETESDSEGDRIARIFELVRLLSDDGAEGGRGSSGGKSRKLDVHGTVTMAATVTEEWPPQDRSRITLIELMAFKDRSDGRAPAPPEVIASMLQHAAEMSPKLRARAIATFALFQANLKVARAAILKLGGQPRDADQLGHLIAGWRTMTSDEPFPEDDLGEFNRFRPFIMSLVEAEDGDDAPGDLLNTIFGSVPDLWQSGERMNVGEMVALARTEEIDAPRMRKVLARVGLRLERQEGEDWPQAWLAVANKHDGLDDLLKRHPKYQGKKRSQILKQLQRGADRALVPDARLRFASVQSRYVLIPPAFLPTWKEEQR